MWWEKLAPTMPGVYIMLGPKMLSEFKYWDVEKMSGGACDMKGQGLWAALKIGTRISCGTEPM